MRLIEDLFFSHNNFLKRSFLYVGLFLNVRFNINTVECIDLKCTA